MNRDCKVCDGGALVFLEKKRNIDGSINDIYICNSCFVVTNIHAFDHDATLQVQASESFYRLDNKEIEKLESYIESNKALLAYVMPYLGEAYGKSMLEIGSGRGLMLVAAKRVGFRKAIGVDMNLGTFKELKRHLVVDDDIVMYKNIEEVREKVDCVIMWHTLEHIPHPRQHLQLMVSRLNESAILFFQVPQYYQPYICSTHYHFYNEPSIRSLMKECKFSVLEIGYDLENQFTTVVARYENKDQ